MSMHRRAFLRNGGLAIAGLSWPALVRAAVAERGPLTLRERLERDLDFVPRRRWSPERAHPRRLQAARLFDRITIHHTGANPNYHVERNSVAYDLQAIQAGHLRRNYGDIGYHFVVDYTGCVWEGRSLDYEGAHVSHHNDGNIGVMLLGNFERQQPSDRQLAGMGVLVAALQADRRIARRRVYGHRDLGQSLCPGRHLYPHVVRLRA